MNPEEFEPEDGQPRLTRSQRRALATEAEAEAKARRQAIANMGELAKYGRTRLEDAPDLLAKLTALHDEHMVEGLPFESFRAGMMELMKEKTAREPMLTAPRFTAYGGQREYSLVNAVRAAVEPRFTGGGYELEMSRELERQTGRRSQGILVPLALLGPQSRAMSTANHGALVPVTQGAFIDVLRARSIVMIMGIGRLGSLVGDVSLPKATGTAAAYWVGEDQEVTESDGPPIGSINISPRTVGGLVTLTHKLLIQSSPDVEQLVRQDLANVIAAAVDAAALSGAGSANQPLGLLGHAIGSDTYTTTPTYADVVAMEGRIAASSADAPGMAYLTDPATAAKLKTKDVGTDTGQFVWSAGSVPGEGRMNGYRAFYSPTVPDGTLIFGDWSQLIMATWGVLDIQADPYGNNFKKGNIAVRALMDCDFAVRHAESFEEIHPAG